MFDIDISMFNIENIITHVEINLLKNNFISDKKKPSL